MSFGSISKNIIFACYLPDFNLKSCLISNFAIFESKYGQFLASVHFSKYRFITVNKSLWQTGETELRRPPGPVKVNTQTICILLLLTDQMYTAYRGKSLSELWITTLLSN